MARNRRKDPVDVLATIRRSVEVSRKHSRRMKLRQLGHLLGYDRWSPQEKDHIQQLFPTQNLVASPSLGQLDADDWVHFTLSKPPSAMGVGATALPPDFFEYVSSLKLETEKEVELHFVSPLFHHLGYQDSQEAAGYRFPMHIGAELLKPEADLVYFADDRHDYRTGHPLVLVECKACSEPPDAGVGQAQSYALYIKPAYYVVTNGNTLQVWRYSGGAVHDQRLLETTRSRIAQDFGELRNLLNPNAALDARAETLAKFAGDAAQAATGGTQDSE